jgi:pimeloyl-ACP methyl ester carboxylesterase
MTAEQRQARLPDTSGAAVRDGVSVHYDVYGDGPVNVLLLPTWSIVPSRFWKAQVPFLARHYRVIAFDGRGSGRSSRPRGPAAFADREMAADAVAVLDATATDRAVVVGFSCGAAWAVHLAAANPERVQGIFAIGPACGLAIVQPDRERARWLREFDEPHGWQKYSRHNWLHGDLADFREFYFGEMFSEPHSTKQLEDTLLWSADADAQTLVDSTAARLGADGAAYEPLEPVAARVRCPVHVVHGTADRLRRHSIGEQLAELTGGSLTLVEGGRARVAGAGSGADQRNAARVHRIGDPPAVAAGDVDPRDAAAAPGIVPVLADRSRPCPAGCRDCHRIAKITKRSGHRVVGAGSGHPGAGRRR